MLCTVLVQLSSYQTTSTLDQADDSNSDQSSLNTDDGDTSDGIDIKEASKHRLAAKANPSSKVKHLKPLSPEERKKVKSKIKKLKDEILKAAKKATAADKQVTDQVTEIRTKLLHAKTLRRDGDDFESEARMVSMTPILF